MIHLRIRDPEIRKRLYCRLLVGSVGGWHAKREQAAKKVCTVSLLLLPYFFVKDNVWDSSALLAPPFPWSPFPCSVADVLLEIHAGPVGQTFTFTLIYFFSFPASVWNTVTVRALQKSGMSSVIGNRFPRICHKWAYFGALWTAPHGEATAAHGGGGKVFRFRAVLSVTLPSVAVHPFYCRVLCILAPSQFVSSLDMLQKVTALLQHDELAARDALLPI